MLRLRIVGRLEAEVDGATVVMPPSERACALIGWLALHPGRHPRGEVAASLWPDVAPDRARANLRTALWAVHHSWGAAGRYVEASRSSVGLARHDIWVDAFDEQVSVADAPLLPGVEDDWAATAREIHRRAVLESLSDRAESAEKRGDLAEAVRRSWELCRLAPLDENAHRSLLQRLLLIGDRASAIQASREFAGRLASELGVRPSLPTRAAHARVRAEKVHRGRPQLFGRADEVARLAGLWRSVSLGAGQIVVLTGEAGIGKSTLIADLAHHVEASGGIAAMAVGMDVAGQTPFATWLELCDGLVESVPPAPSYATWPRELNRLSGHLGERLGSPGLPSYVAAPELERLRVFDAVLRLVEWSCENRPTLLVLDDAHRADRASLRLTAHVGRRLAGIPVLLVLAHRGGVLSTELSALTAELAVRVPVVEIALPPLADRAIEALTAARYPLGAEAVRRVVESAEGNPLLAVEAGQGFAAGEGYPSPSLRSSVRASCGRLPEAGAWLVHVLAAAGRPLTSTELDRLGLVDIETLEGLCAAEGLVIRRQDALGFRHELLREAVYADIANPARLHDRVVEILDPERHADIAHHLAAAGRMAEAAGQWSFAAADARRAGALGEARDLLGLATSASPGDGRLWLELQDVCAWTGRHLEMGHAWDRAMALLPDDELAAAWCRRGRQLRSGRCHPAESLSAYSAASDLLTESSERRLRADVLLGLAWAEAVTGDVRKFEDLIGRAETVLSARPDAVEMSDIVEIRMQALIRQGQFAHAVELATSAPAHVVSARLPDRAFAILVNAACALTCLGDHLTALALADRAVDATAALAPALIDSLAARAQVLARMGRHEEATMTAQRQLAAAECLGAPNLVATTAHDAGLIALAAGRHAEAAALLDRALIEGARVSRPTAGLRCAEALARGGDAEGAVRCLHRAMVEPAGRADQPWSLNPQIAFVRGLIAWADGDLSSARHEFHEASAGWRQSLVSVTAKTADGYGANLVELGRPPVMGLIDPSRELNRLEAAGRLLGLGRRLVD